ncbi:MAG: Na+/H+ antiporter NhaA [Desulfobulbaceae bacterium DB1]|nr:MAG: Na+/H+ antiporter NhaA [Desulfobulbaceae bacterium DB1]
MMLKRFFRKTAPVYQIISPFQALVKKLATSGFILFYTTAAAMLWANFHHDSYQHLWHLPLAVSLGDVSFSKSILHWIDEALMTLFFFVVGLEIKREILIGELSSMRRALLPVAGAVGGMLAPALIYAIITYNTDAAHGWGIPMATDIAFALAVLSLLSKRIPYGLKIFLSALAIADDIGAVLVIALFYTATIHWAYLGFAALLLVCLFVANLLWIRHTLVYALLGLGIWWAFLGAGIHATAAGVLVALFIPARGKYDTNTFVNEVRSFLVRFDCRNGDCGHTILLNQNHLNAVQAIELACHQTETPLQRLEHGLGAWISYLVVPLFALANAGVAVRTEGLTDTIRHPATMGVILALVIGKPVGITLFSLLASKALKAPLSGGMNWLHVIGAGMLGGIGFTMSIFISGLSFQSTELIDMTKIGIIIGSLLSAALGVGVLLTADFLHLGQSKTGTDGKSDVSV